MNLSALEIVLNNSNIRTPAYIYDLDQVRFNAEFICKLACKNNVKQLYAVKACSLPGVISILSEYVDGFSCSSVFELDIADIWCSAACSYHWVNPIIKEDEKNKIFDKCHKVTFNSIGQLNIYLNDASNHGNSGLRINPGLSNIEDARYDPCAEGSRLGMRIENLYDETDELKGLKFINGIHFHTACDSIDSQQIDNVVQYIIRDFGAIFDELQWVNIGGGYLPTKWNDDTGFSIATGRLREKWGCEIYFEPGAAFVRDAGYLVATVCDLVKTPSGEVAILDTTVNHWPEIFEYQFEPDVQGHTEQGRYNYTLAGRTCLAGDLFGNYSFSHPLNVGSRVIFFNAGAYSIVKAHTFNGIYLPEIYYLLDGNLVHSTNYEARLNQPILRNVK